MTFMKNKFIAVILAIMVAVAWSVPAFADDEVPADSETKAKAVKVEEPAPAKEEPVAETPKEEPSAETQAETSEPNDSSDISANDVTTKKETVKAAEGGHSTFIEINDSTSLADGTYDASDVNFSGGTGKTSITCDKVIVSGGKAKAVIRFSSTKITHFFTGTVDKDHNGDDNNVDLFDADSNAIGKGVYKTNKDANGSFATIPVSIGSEMELSARTTAMSEAHWVNYTVSVIVSEEDRTEDVGIQDGTYKPDSFRFIASTGKASMTCEKVIVINGKATAVLSISSDKITHVYMGEAPSDTETPSLYDPESNKCGQDVYRVGNKQVSVPVILNQEAPISARTTAMSEPHWIHYAYELTLTEDSEKISDSTEIPANPGETTEPTDPTEPTNPEDPVDPDPQDQTKLNAGTWKVKATTDRKMFYLYPSDQDPAWTILKINKDGSMTATITLNGTGYDYVYMGTAAQARSAGKANWIKGVKENGYYTFTIPVSALDKKLTISPHSWKYETDTDPTTDPWRDGKWIIFYSKDAKKVEDGTSIETDPKKDETYPTSGSQTKFDNDKKADKVSKWKDDRNKSTSAVNNSTTLKDGVYSPDKFRWSGGSGRLAYIHCNKITVRGGKAYATIEFGSSKYDSLKANGRVYSRSGGGNSKFVIPVRLNANNTIIGRTTAMSQPHWVKYTIFVYKAGATGKDGENGAGDGLVNTNKLSDKAPELIGLENTGTVKIEHAKLFRIFTYEQGVTLISIDQNSGTALYKKVKKNEKKDVDEVNGEEKIEYDEDGKPIPKSESEITNELYQNNVVNYIVAPEDVELPAGIEKDCIIIKKPVDSAFVSSENGADDIEKLGKKKALESNKEFGEYDKPDYKKIVLEETDLAVLPADALPAKVTKKSSDEDKELSEEKTKTIQKLQTRYSSLSVPLLVDRSQHEASNYGEAEWIKVYGAIFGEEKAADDVFDKFVKNNKKEKLTNENNE